MRFPWKYSTNFPIKSFSRAQVISSTPAVAGFFSPLYLWPVHQSACQDNGFFASKGTPRFLSACHKPARWSGRLWAKRPRRPKKLPKIRLIAQLLRQPCSAINISPPVGICQSNNRIRRSLISFGTVTNLQYVTFLLSTFFTKVIIYTH